MGGISIWQLLIILVIVLLLFGTKKLRSIGSDLGGAIKGFRESMGGEKAEAEAGEKEPQKIAHSERVVEGEQVKADSEKATRS